MTGEDEWGGAFEVAGVDRARFEWTQHRLVEHLGKQWKENPMGPHCENTKIWPFCLSAAGLGLQLYDSLFNKQTHEVYDEWLAHTKDKYYVFDSKGALELATFYYDPLVEHFQRVGPNFGLALSFYTMPQAPAFGEFLYRASVKGHGWDGSNPVVATPDPRLIVLGLAVAKEYGDYATYAKLRSFVENNFEPRYFGDDGGEFGFYFGFGEDYPRGQLSALALCAEVGDEGSWRKLFCAPNTAKFTAPTVEGIDYPALGVAQAYNDRASGCLHLSLFAGSASRKGEESKFRVCSIADSGDIKVFCDSAEWSKWHALDDGTIEIETTIESHQFQIFTGYTSEAKQKNFITQRNDGGVRKLAAAPKAALKTGANKIIAPPPSMMAGSCCGVGITPK
jgi:hypothetical protein